MDLQGMPSAEGGGQGEAGHFPELQVARGPGDRSEVRTTGGARHETCRADTPAEQCYPTPAICTFHTPGLGSPDLVVVCNHARRWNKLNTVLTLPRLHGQGENGANYCHGLTRLLETCRAGQRLNRRCAPIRRGHRASETGESGIHVACLLWEKRAASSLPPSLTLAIVKQPYQSAEPRAP